nr:MAG: pyocin activator protein [Bacteriophage sp.]
MLFTVSEVAKRIKINKSTVYELIKKGHLKALKLGSMKVTAAELESFLNKASEIDFSFYVIILE